MLNLIKKYTNKLTNNKEILWIIAAILITTITVVYLYSTKEEEKKEEKVKQIKEHVPKVEVEIVKPLPKEKIITEEVKTEPQVEEQQNVEPKQTEENEELKGGFYLYDIPLSEDIQKYIWEQAEYYGISVELIYAIAKIESNFNPNIVTSEGSKGMFQLHEPSETLGWLARIIEVKGDIDVFDWSNPKHSASAAIWYLDYLREYWLGKGYSEEQVFALSVGSYNMGIGSMSSYIKSNDPYDWYYVKKVLDYKVKLEKQRLD